MWTLYESILSLCGERGIRGGKMCVDLGLSKSLMTDLKSGRKKGITAETAQKIAEYFGVSVDRVLSGPDTETAPSKNGEGKRRAPSAETLKLLELLESRDDIRYLAAASEKATPEHVKATAEMFDKMYGRHSEE